MLRITSEIITALKKDGVGVLPTDTLYGLVGSAFSALAVKKIYQLKKRDPHKPLIILIADFEDLAKFEVVLSSQLRQFLDSVWPGPVSVVLPVQISKWEYLLRGGQSLAFRLPGKEELREFLRQSGPLVAPSANPEGQAPATNVHEARNYFGEHIDFYVDGGVLQNPPSGLLKVLPGGSVEKLR